MKKPLKTNQLGCGRVLQSLNWGIGKSSNNPGFPWQTQCNLLVPTLLLGLGFREVKKEDREVKPHQEETKVVNLGKKERKSRSALACPGTSEMNW